MSTTCKECNRAVLKEHVDASGNCIFCAKPPKPSEPSAPKSDK